MKHREQHGRSDAAPNLSVAALRQTLAEHHGLTSQTPLFNPVGQLGFDLSRELEAGHIKLADLGGLADELEATAFNERAERRHNFVGPVDQGSNIKRFADLVRATATAGDFSAFAQTWSRQTLGCVFTGHPTFMLSPEDNEALAQTATAPRTRITRKSPSKAPAITIESEHAQALSALGRAADAHDILIGVILKEAREAFPRHWHTLRPQPFGFSTWVGYDMDGRTDIPWTTSVRFRLREKAFQLQRYGVEVAKILSPLAEDHAIRSDLAALSDQLDAAHSHTLEMLNVFSGKLDTPATLSDAANALTAEHPARLTSVEGMLAALDGMIAKSEGDLAAALVHLASVMRCHRLGVGHVHFRINASQLHNAIRRRLGGDAALAMNSRSALVHLQKLLAEVEALPVNFAALAIENTTAVRQFLAMAQILKHVDADSSIRLLIAESEQPVTVLAAVYFAKLFGIAGKVDISPLFETEAALEHGSRILDALLADPYYQAYVCGRGRVTIQTGFSDAGRFLGQVPASLAIERLQGALARLMGKHGLSDVSALIFNTHGESMGRGAHPVSVRDRLAHVMSPWARGQFVRQKLKLDWETSFQGGDGFGLFGTLELALALLTRIAEAERDLKAAAATPDPFYDEIDISLDFYRAVREVQVQFFAEPTYGRAVTAFGLSLLRESGSRKTRRQSDVSMPNSSGLSKIRAIPHNAAMQQMGYPVNVIAGVGRATEGDLNRFAELHRRSPRAQGLMRLVQASNALASIKTLIAYGELFDGGFWATRPYRGRESNLETACQELAERFAVDDRAAAFRKLATYLRVDGLKLHRLLSVVAPEGATTQGEDQRRTMGVLHALRLALMQHIFLKAAQIPPFSVRNDLSRDDVMELIFALRIPEALELLRAAYPVERPGLEDFKMQEPTKYPDDNVAEYATIHSNYIDPIAESYDIILKIGTAIAHHFGAVG
ncbi:MAG: phosphoenolpyruvate carboxylase [Rhodospirillaceae bacterium]|nr:phosphoenolpyruvate carboxylase [Rhodospirillaceae bacterium]